MRRVVATLAAIIAVVIIAGAVLISSGADYVGADRPHWPATAWLLNEARDRSIPAQATRIPNPPG